MTEHADTLGPQNTSSPCFNHEHAYNHRATVTALSDHEVQLQLAPETDDMGSWSWTVGSAIALAIGKQDSYDIAFRIIRTDGMERWVRKRARVVVGATTTVTGIVVELTDQLRATTRKARLHGGTAALVAALTPNDVAEAVIQQMLGALEADAGAVYAPADDGVTCTTAFLPRGESQHTAH
jgi:hypothetical protein